MKFRLICNPGSRAGRGRRHWQFWIDALRRTGIQVDLCVTRTPDEARQLAIETDADTLVAVGGDGTINRVLDGVLSAGREHLRMGVLYAGTSPDFCRFHRIPTAPEAALQTLINGSTNQVNAAEIIFCGASGTEHRHFGCSANIGLGPAVAHRSNAWRPCLGDRAGTAAAAILAIFQMRPMNLRLTLDGAEQTLESVNHLTVAINPYLASGLKLNLPLRSDAGALAMVAVCRQTRAGLIRLLPKFYSGKICDHPDVTTFRATTLRIEAEDPRHIEFDGDRRGMLPVSIRLLPQRLPLICPDPPSKGADHA